MQKVGNTKRILGFTAAFVIVLSFLFALSLVPQALKSTQPIVYVGVDAAFASVNDTKQLVDEVKSYTNLFVVGSTAITWNESSLNDVCQYLNDSGLPFMTFSHPGGDQFFSGEHWLSEARQKWGSTYRGLYVYDEAGGHQLEHDTFFMSAPQADNYSDAASRYVQNLTYYLSLVKSDWKVGSFPIVSSDYALYEYDYRAGYSAVFAEFYPGGYRELSVALCRGAATVHESDWGVMITGNLNDSKPKSGQQIYEDMVYAYQNGAKYILIFDYPSLQGGILKHEHFDALKQFWSYIQTHPCAPTEATHRVAYIVPKDYGFGFRGATDKIWGLWEADNQSAKIWSQVNSLIQQYGANLDVVYEDAPNLNSTGYNKLILWNGTEITP